MEIASKTSLSASKRTANAASSARKPKASCLPRPPTPPETPGPMAKRPRPRAKPRQRSANVPTAAKWATSRQTKSACTAASPSARASASATWRPIPRPMRLILFEHCAVRPSSSIRGRSRDRRSKHRIASRYVLVCLFVLTMTSARGLLSPSLFTLVPFLVFPPEEFANVDFTADSVRSSTARSSRKTASTTQRSWAHRRRCRSECIRNWIIGFEVGARKMGVVD